MFTTQGKSQVHHVTNVPSQPIPRKAKNNQYPKGGTLRQSKIHLRIHVQSAQNYVKIYAFHSIGQDESDSRCA